VVEAPAENGGGIMLSANALEQSVLCYRTHTSGSGGGSEAV
jgi:hypothetical protein